MAAAAVAERCVVVPLEASERIKAQMRQYRREGARLSAMIILAEPQRIGEQTVGDYLMQIPYMRRETVSGWLRHAGINPWRPCSQLRSHERRLIAGQLVNYSKGE